MSVIVPSYVQKVARAKEHLLDLHKAVSDFSDTHPYTVSERIEGKKKRRVWRLEFTASPGDTLIPVIAADAIYNLRASLDHLMNAIVAPKDRSSAMFPIYFQGVWDPASPGEDEQRVKQRARWASDIKTLPDAAVAVLKDLQPADTAADNPQTNILRLVNRLSNHDRHRNLPVVATGLAEFQARVMLPDGTVLDAIGDHPPGQAAIQDKAELQNIPEDAVNVEVRGTTLVAIPGRLENRYIEVPRRLLFGAVYIEETIIPKLALFER